MPTNFINIDSERKKSKRKTRFTHVVNRGAVREVSDVNPYEWDNVVFLGHDTSYGDVFKSYNNTDEPTFALYFGVKGDEFD